LQLDFSLCKCRLGHRDYTAASLPPLPAQAHDASDFIETEAERLCFANESHLLQRRIIIYAVTTCRSEWLWEKPAPLVKTDCVGLHSRKLRQPPNQQRPLVHRVRSAACPRVMRPSNVMAPS